MPVPAACPYCRAPRQWDLPLHRHTIKLSACRACLKPPPDDELLYIACLELMWRVRARAYLVTYIDTPQFQADIIDIVRRETQRPIQA